MNGVEGRSIGEKMVKERIKKFGRGANSCRRCGRKSGLVRRYGIYLCRQCFREIASQVGFRKYN